MKSIAKIECTSSSRMREKPLKQMIREKYPKIVIWFCHSLGTIELAHYIMLIVIGWMIEMVIRIARSIYIMRQLTARAITTDAEFLYSWHPRTTENRSFFPSERRTTCTSSYTPSPQVVEAPSSIYGCPPFPNSPSVGSRRSFCCNLHLIFRSVWWSPVSVFTSCQIFCDSVLWRFR